MTETTNAQFTELDSLDELLNESMTQKAERDAVKEAQKKLARGGMSKDETDQTQALVARWSNQREWKRSANVLVFTRQRCRSCGAYHSTLDGFFERYDNVRIASAHKNVQVPAFELPHLPKDVEYRDSEVKLCHLCADDAGYPLQED